MTFSGPYEKHEPVKKALLFSLPSLNDQLSGASVLIDCLFNDSLDLKTSDSSPKLRQKKSHFSPGENAMIKG